MKCKVFSATKSNDRNALGEQVTAFLQTPGVEVLEKEVLQSSDNEFHCLSIVLWYKGGASTPAQHAAVR